MEGYKQFLNSIPFYLCGCFWYTEKNILISIISNTKTSMAFRIGNCTHSVAQYIPKGSTALKPSQFHTFYVAIWQYLSVQVPLLGPSDQTRSQGKRVWTSAQEVCRATWTWWTSHRFRLHWPACSYISWQKWVS